ncbi:MAG: PhzF family phenazine biosynthesis protein [Rhodoferax sp.]|nr:PhzF family phenazine biosynthesis protein [Rhodoferax sp.]
MQIRPYKQVDVFTSIPYLGNPLAVVLNGADLNDTQMQSFARWTHLSETTFVLPPSDPKADYHLRIFTPGGELPFAGHPTLGSCHAWLEAGGKPKTEGLVVQQCGVGLVTIRREESRLAFSAPPMRRNAPGATLLARIAKALGLTAEQIIAAQLLDNGTAWLGLLLDHTNRVLQLTPNFLDLKDLGYKVGVVAMRAEQAAGTAGEVPGVEVRAFAPHMGINEDPVTGSLNASLAQWLISEGHAPARYLATQGACLQRAGHVFIESEPSGQVWVGGHSVTCIDGQVTL